MKKEKLSFTVLQSSNFRILLLTRMFSMMALQAQAVIVGWQIYTLTKNPFLLGLTGLFEAVPAIACALFAGHIVDISKPQRIYFYCLGLLTLNTIFLMLIGGGILPLSPLYFLPLVYSAIFISGFARSFIMPSSFSLLAQIIPRKDISSASAWLSSGFHAATIVAPAMAGIIYGGYGALVAWMMPTILMSISLIMVLFLKTEDYVRAVGAREPAMQSIKAGWTFIMKSPILLSAMMLDMLAVLFGGAIALLPAFADQILEIGSEGLGILRAAPAIGAIVMALALAVRPMKTIPVTRLLWVVVGFGVCMVGFGVSTSFWLSLVFLTLSGAFDSVSMVIRGTLMQLYTPENMRGRVSSVNSMFIVSSNELGAFYSGTMAKLLGLVPAVIVGGFATLFVSGATAILSPSFRKTVVIVDEQSIQKAPAE